MDFEQKLMDKYPDLFYKNEEAVRTALDGHKWKKVVNDFNDFLRTEWKYRDNDAAWDIQEKLIEMMNNQNLSLDE